MSRSLASWSAAVASSAPRLRMKERGEPQHGPGDDIVGPTEQIVAVM